MRANNAVCSVFEQRVGKFNTKIMLYLTRVLFRGFKDQIQDKLEYIDTLELKQRVQDEELFMTRSSYRVIKQKMGAKEQEVERLQAQYEEARGKGER